MTAVDLHRSLEGALLGTFAGDAVGRSYEGSTAVERNDAESRLAAALEHELTYTDDTQLAIALAVHLAEHPNVDPDAFVTTMLDHFESWRGYGGGMHAIVAAWRRELPLDAAAVVQFEQGSFGNGAAMRVAPLGVLHAEDPDRLESAMERSARPTHVHPVGIDGARVQAHAVAVARRNGRFGAEELREAANRARTEAMRGPLSGAIRLSEADPSPAPPAIAQRLGNGVVAHRSVATALFIAANATDVPDAMVTALGVGGDTDTIAAMAGAIRGAAEGPDGIPDDWIDRMEDGERGVTYVRELAAHVASEVPT